MRPFERLRLVDVAQDDRMIPERTTFAGTGDTEGANVIQHGPDDGRKHKLSTMDLFSD